ncbi:hypothetical protein V1281_004909 [Nitrobacteraceae bacterium AZCC 2161]
MLWETRGGEGGLQAESRNAIGAAETADCAALGGSTGWAYLDDLGVNLKPAREMGMTTIKVLDAK